MKVSIEGFNILKNETSMMKFFTQSGIIKNMRVPTSALINNQF
jgi:hypothetical protein